MKKTGILICLVLFTTLLCLSKNRVSAFKDLKKGKKDIALKSFLEISKKDSSSLIANYALALLYCDSNLNQYNLELAYKYSQKASSCLYHNYAWNEEVTDKELNDILKLKISPLNVSSLKDSIICLIFSHVKIENTINAYEQYIQQYPDSKLIKDAKLCIFDLAYSFAKKSNTIEGYENFLAKYPDAVQSTSAKEIVHTLAFNKAKEINSAEAYKQFLAKYPNAKEADEAKRKINVIYGSGLFPIISKNKIGFINNNNEIIIFPKYDFTNGFHEGYAMIQKNELWGLIDAQGNEITPQKYEDVSNFKEGLVGVKFKNLWGFIGLNGHQVVPFEYDGVRDFNDGMALVIRNGKFGFVNTNGEQIIKCKYDFAGSFCDGLAMVELKNGDESSCGYIEKNGKTIIPLRYNKAFDFKEGLARVVNSDGDYGFVNRFGNEVSPCKFYDAGDYYEGLARVSTDSGWGFIDVNANTVIPCSFEDVSDFHEGIARVVKNGLKGYINKAGQEIIPSIYEMASLSFSDGLSNVKRNGKWSYIDKTGKDVIICNYDEIYNFNKGIACVMKNGKYGAIDKTGKEIIPCIYNNDLNFGIGGGLSRVWNDYLNGFIDRNGHFISDKSENSARIGESNNNSPNDVEKKGKTIQRVFTRFIGFAEDEDNFFRIEIDHAEMNEPNSKDELILSGEMYQYVKYRSFDNTPMGQIISLATGNEKVVAAEKVTFHCPKSELNKEWSFLYCEGFFNFTSIKVKIDWSLNIMRTRLIAGNKDFALQFGK